MAITDDQLDELKNVAFSLGAEDAKTRDHQCHPNIVLGRVFDNAHDRNMRTEDEFNEIVTIDDLPAQEDRRDLVDAYARGWDESLSIGA